jgi:hypothetical protein
LVFVTYAKGPTPTVSVSAGDVMFPRAAVIIVLPVVVVAVAKPVVGAIVATLVLEEDHVTEVVMFFVVVSL